MKHLLCEKKLSLFEQFLNSRCVRTVYEHISILGSAVPAGCSHLAGRQVLKVEKPNSYSLGLPVIYVMFACSIPR